MKVTILSNFDLASGRGPVFRLINIIPLIAKEVDLTVISLQEPDSLCKRVFVINDISYEVVQYLSQGWSIIDSDNLALKITDILFKNRTDVCVLGWEFWDLAVALHNKLEFSSCKFAVVFHSIPFVDALPFPGNYERDISMRISTETNTMISNYLTVKAHDARKYINKFNIISINQTVSYYLNVYFPELLFFSSYPGYALNVSEINLVVQSEKIYDYVFMSKLETSKGIFDLIEIAAGIKKINPGFKMRIIGDFLYESEKEAALDRIIKLQLEDNISFAGWLTNDEKYKELKKAKIFLYPSLTGDTFSFCLLEALACGLHVVAYDTPFTRIIYKDAPVYKVKYRNIPEFVGVAIDIINSFTNEYSTSAKKFVYDHYSDWKLVASAEVQVYHELLEK